MKRSGWVGTLEDGDMREKKEDQKAYAGSVELLCIPKKMYRILYTKTSLYVFVGRKNKVMIVFR